MKYFFILLLLATYHISFAQDWSRKEIIILDDTTFDANSDPSRITHPRINRGMKVVVSSNPYRVTYIAEKKDNIVNGLWIYFYPKTNMPQEKGSYMDGEKNLEWYYWDAKGVLKKKELWSKGRLIKTINYK